MSERKYTDEKLVELFMANGNYAEIAKLLGVSKQAIASRLSQLRRAGVRLPKHVNGLTPARISSLNKIIDSMKQGES